MLIIRPQITDISDKETNHCIYTAFDYGEAFDIRRTESQNLKVPRLGLQLSLRNILKPGVKPRMKM